MNWDAVGAIAEGIGALGVIASLLYLSVQVRGNNLASAIESKLAASRFYGDFLGSLIQDPELNEMYLRGRKDLASLAPSEYVRFSNLALQSFSLFSAVYFQFIHGKLSDGDWYEYRAIIQFWLRGRGCRTWWARVGRHMFGPDFVGYIDSQMPTDGGAQQGIAADQQQLV